MGLIGFSRFLGRSRCTRPLAASPIHSHRHQISILPNLDSDPYPDYGTYSIILPPEPFQFGTSHFPVLPVPSSIPRPPYVIEGQLGNDKGHSDTGDPWEGDGKIELNTDEEAKIRNAARLAKRVREFAGGLVKVCPLLPPLRLCFILILQNSPIR